MCILFPIDHTRHGSLYAHEADVTTPMEIEPGALKISRDWACLMDLMDPAA